MKKLVFAFFIVLSAKGFAQTSVQLNSGEILQSLKKLNTIGSVLYIAAHPDDENTRLLAYLSKEKNLRTGYLSITRGDGGQNLIGKEQGEALGVIRTQELLAARRIDGAEQFFTRAYDFGYSKNPEETFTFWNKDSVLADMVWVIRNFKPEIIICRFPTTGEGGHGHHTASAILAEEAFEAAADPKKFPHQLKSVTTWKTTRLFWNTFNFGSTNTTAEDQIKVDVGIFNPLLGKSYGEIAAESRTMHKSQGFGSGKGRGESIEYFKQLKGEKVNSLFEKIDHTWKRFPATAKFDKMTGAVIKKFNPQSPQLIIPDLAAIHKQLSSLNEADENISYWKKIKLQEIEQLLVACAGIFAEAYATVPSAVPGEEINISAVFIQRNATNVKLNKINYLQTDTVPSMILKNNQLYTFKRKEKIAPDALYTNPYWLYENHSKGLFTVNNPLLIGTPENFSPTRFIFHFEIGGVPIKLSRPLVQKTTDPVKGEIYRPFEIVAPVTVKFMDKVYIADEKNPAKIKFIVTANTDNVKGTLTFPGRKGWKIEFSENKEIVLTKKGEEATFELIATPEKTANHELIEAGVNINNIFYSASEQRIIYDHIPQQVIVTKATAKLLHLKLHRNGLRIGYIPGAGDDIPASLHQAGMEVTELSEEKLRTLDLNKNFDAIVTGVRAYNTEQYLQTYYNKLMEYVSKGGNLVVQYNTNNRIGPLTAKIGPYPFTISRERVTDENAEVRLLKPDHPALKYPHKITADDFEGWIQERGIYFATDADKNYEPILSMNDANENPQEGSLIIAKHGKGNFVYTGIAFFRELPAGVPGAFRLFENLLNLPDNQ